MIPPKGEKWEVLLGVIFLSSSGNLSGSNFDHLKLFDVKQHSINIEH